MVKSNKNFQKKPSKSMKANPKSVKEEAAEIRLAKKYPVKKGK